MFLKTDTFDAKEDRLRETDATHQPWQSIIADGLPRVLRNIKLEASTRNFNWNKEIGKDSRNANT